LKLRPFEFQHSGISEGDGTLYGIADYVHNEFTTVKRIYNEKQVPHTLLCIMFV